MLERLSVSDKEMFDDRPQRVGRQKRQRTDDYNHAEQ
jgi:hypothetical protein